MLKRWKPVESIDALGGDGVIAGELSGDPAVPDGLLTVNGVPTTREIEVRDRKTRRVVAVRRSNADGTYRFPGLNPALQYDVIARDFAGDFEDVIAGAVRPHTPDLLVPVAAGGKMEAFSDPFAEDVVLLLHFDGEDGSTTFTDQTGKEWTAYGNAQIDTAQSKFGGASGLFDGSGDYISAGSSSDWAFGSGSFTVELFVRFTSHGSVMSFLSNYVSGGAHGWSFQRRSDTNTIRFNYGDTALIDVSWTPTDGVWYHLAVCRAGTSIRIFVDGTQIGSTVTAGTDISNTSGLNIGRLAGLGVQYFNGHMDEVRITKGVARYTSNFTPPTAPFDL